MIRGARSKRTAVACGTNFLRYLGIFTFQDMETNMPGEQVKRETVKSSKIVTKVLITSRTGWLVLDQLIGR